MRYENDFAKDKPLYTTSVAASILNITPDRLRTYDLEKLIVTHRISTGRVQKRLYSQYDIEWLKGIRILVKDYRMSIASIKILFNIININPKINLPKDEFGEILHNLIKNPNFKCIIENSINFSKEYVNDFV